jgi:membrane-bound serine protease (ClpP class)
MISVNLGDFFSVWVAGILVSIAIAVALAYLAYKAYRNRITTGEEGIIGERGEYKGDGLAQVRGELWKVENGNELSLGDRVEVISLDRLLIKVKRL